MTTSHREYIAKHGRPSDELVQEIVRRIVEVADPDRIILFGSGARGDMGKHSDLDFLVIKSGDYDRRGLTGKVYRRMFGLGHPVDIVVSSPESVNRYKDFKPMIYYPALTEGREVYALKANASCSSDTVIELRENRPGACTRRRSGRSA
jgi:predicted nucleotidyltransferase